MVIINGDNKWWLKIVYCSVYSIQYFVTEGKLYVEVLIQDN